MTWITLELGHIICATFKSGRGASWEALPRRALIVIHKSSAIRRDSGTDALLYRDVMNTADRDVGEG